MAPGGLVGFQAAVDQRCNSYKYYKLTNAELLSRKQLTGHLTNCTAVTPLTPTPPTPTPSTNTTQTTPSKPTAGINIYLIT